ncbi:MAG: Poly-beta-hydroxybutyrate polymerase, partial [Pseudomonadota bacterium]
MDQNAAHKSLGDSWLKALASFKTIGGGDASTPSLSFAPGDLELLQKQYIAEATELWNTSLNGKSEVKDRRFKG